MSKPPNTLLDRPVYRDWAVWLSCAVALVMLWQVVDIYLIKAQIWGVLGTKGAGTALFMELLITAMAATFVGVVVTSLRRTARKLWFRRHLKRNVEFLTPVNGRNGNGQPPNGRHASLTP